MNVLSSVVLVLATLAIGLGLGAITAGLTAPLPAPEGSAQDRPLVAGEGALPMGHRSASADRVQPPGTPRDRWDDPTPTPVPPMSARGPWKSPLYPQNGVTLWDRIRVSAPRDRRAFLLGTGIQVHAGAAGASPLPS
jgi:hypothetical protein